MSDTAAEMPRYQCHKQVWALKIESIELVRVPSTEGQGELVGAFITPVEEGYTPFRVDREYVQKHEPQAGGYYVVYKDGYASFSPAQAFEEGYTRI